VNMWVDLDRRIKTAADGRRLGLDGGLDPAAEAVPRRRALRAEAERGAEVFSAVVGGAYAEAVEYGSGESRGIAIRGGRLVAWREEGGRREVLADLLLDERSAELVYEALKRTDGAQFGALFEAVANAEMCIGADGRASFCCEGFDCAAELLGA